MTLVPPRNFMAITGYEDAMAVHKIIDDFSLCVALGGSSLRCRSLRRSADLNAQIDANRAQFPMFEHMATLDPPEHTKARPVLSRLMTPKRLKENENFMWRLTERQLDEFIGQGKCEFLTEYAKPFSLLVIADFLGVPEEDHQGFRVVLGTERPGAMMY